MFKESPLIGCAHIPGQVGVDGNGVMLEEIAFCTHLNLRCDPTDIQALIAASAVLGVELPLTPNTFNKAADIRIYWLGPDEWLVVAPMTHADLFEKIKFAWTGFHHSVTDITGGQTVVRIEGERVSELINQGCTLDLHDSVFQVGHCAQSLLAQVPVLIIRSSDSESGNYRFDLVVRRSYADHLARWIADAACEIGFVNKLGMPRWFSSLTNESKM